MSDVKEKLGATAEMGKSEENSKKGKIKFTPPILHKYGEIVKICQAQTTQGQQDFYTNSS